MTTGIKSLEDNHPYFPLIQWLSSNDRICSVVSLSIHIFLSCHPEMMILTFIFAARKYIDKWCNMIEPLSYWDISGWRPEAPPFGNPAWQTKFFIFSMEFLDHPRNRHFDIATGDSEKEPAIYLQTKARVLYNHRVRSYPLTHIITSRVTPIHYKNQWISPSKSSKSSIRWVCLKMLGRK